MKKINLISLAVVLMGGLVLVSGAHAETLTVPAQYPTIQAAINAAEDGDTVLVSPGTYVENINFNGKEILVDSLFVTTGNPIYINLTIIDGNQVGSVVTFNHREGLESILKGFTITNGHATIYGGGIYCYYSHPTLENLTISGNASYYIGGGISCNYSSPTLENLTISGNTANWWAGGIYCGLYSYPTIENVTISGNTAGYTGGILCHSNSSPTIENVIISGNTATYAGGGIYCSSSLTLENSILWGNSPNQVSLNGGTLTVTYSNVEGGWVGGLGNINADPLFIDPTNNDYHLQVGSPCIDAGNPDSIYNDPEDPSNPGYALYPALGTIRNDMGAYGGPSVQ